MAPFSFLLYTLLTFSLSIHEISSAEVKFVVVNEAVKTPGGVKFEQKIGGIPATKDIMAKTTQFILSTVLKQNTPADRKPVDTVQVIIKDYKGAEAITQGNKIDVSAVYLDIYKKGDLKWEFTSLLHHEMTHVFQWNGEGKCPVPLIEGIADYTILKANYYPTTAAKPGAGKKWDEGYDVTAQFLKYCDSLVPDFVAKLNKMLRTGYDVSFFKNLTGKPVEQLWKDYKAKYGQKV